MPRILVTVIGGVLLTGLADGVGAQTVTGTALYRERMALPVGATFDATLEDVSRADAPADVIGKARIESASNPPYKFSITYDPSKIDQTHLYNVRARITFKDEVLFTSDQAYPVITGGHPNHISIVMKMVVAHGASKPLSNPVGAGKPPAQTAAKPPAQGAAKPPPPQGAPKPPPLVGTHWTLTQLGEAPVAATGSERDAHLVFASEGSRVTGSTGCNRLTGTYTRKGDALTFGPAATTKMACIGAAQETETKMLAALQATTSGKITGSELALSDKAGAVVARFVKK
jgi:putative lipoprotein